MPKGRGGRALSNLRLATFNVNSIRSRLEIVQAWLDRHRPDVLALQETKVTDALFPRAPFEEQGYTVHQCGQKAYNGVAIISRTPPEHVTFGFDDGAGPSDGPRLMRATFADVTVVNTYVPQGRAIDHAMYRYKIDWFKRLRKWFDRHFTLSDALIWTGDMNVAHDPIDVHNPEARANHVCYHQAARDAFAHCRAWGFVDTFRNHHPEGGHYTFFDYRNPDNIKNGKGWRLDYILASPSMAARCRNAFIDLEPRLKPKPSDHVVMVADFKA